MAAITAVAGDSLRAQRITSKTAQATTGQVSWIRTPRKARSARFTLTVTATAGTTPSIRPQLISTDPVTADDAVTQNVGGFATSGGITSTGSVVYEVGPGITGIANATAAIGVSGASTVQVNALLPDLLGIQIVNDRTDGNETYTYTLTVEYRGV